MSAIIDGRRSGKTLWIEWRYFMSKQYILRSESLGDSISLETLQDIVERVKKLYDSPRDFVVCYDYHNVELIFESLETDKEYQARTKREQTEQRASEKRKLELEKKERKLLEKLQKKYGG